MSHAYEPCLSTELWRKGTGPAEGLGVLRGLVLLSGEEKLSDFIRAKFISIQLWESEAHLLIFCSLGRDLVSLNYLKST
jgi:hypothetical protein